MKKNLLLTLLVCCLGFSARSQCEYINQDFEDWTLVNIELDPGLANDVLIPDNHFSALRFLFNYFNVLFGIPPYEQMFLTDPQLFFGIDRSTDASSGSYAIKLQADDFVTIADIFTANACTEVPDTFKIDIKHVGTHADSFYIYGAFDLGITPLPESFDMGLDTLPAVFVDSLFLSNDTGYFTLSLPVLVNDATAPTDTFTLFMLTTSSSMSYFLIDNIRLVSASLADADNDGFTSDVDCDDNNPAVNPGALEVCNGIDDNCDGMIDEGVLITFYLDSDNDGFGDSNTTVQDCTAPVNYVANGDDCDDTLAEVYPGAPEICDGLDNDCNGMIDDNVTFQDYYLDADNDGYGTGDPVNDCQSPGPGYVLVAGDCDDTNGDINPGAVEACNGIDDNCDGMIDEGVLLTFYLDSDNDGFGDSNTTIQDCTAPANYVTNGDDCDDTLAEVYPGAPEVCDGIDNDCNGMIDDNLTFQDYYLDGDNDGFGAGDPVNDCTSPGTGYVLVNGDCDDADPNINPGITEICNGIDDNCDGQIDEGLLTTYYTDADMDGYGDPANFTQSCDQPPGTATNGDDCDDANPDINPGATEICNGIDDNCDGQIDEGLLTTYYTDADMDGYGDPANFTQSCDQPPGTATNGDDCDDANPDINPGATEICNGIDDNCDGQIDEGLLTTYYFDADLDGYGNADNSIDACEQPPGTATNGDDCDDTNSDVNPAATEVCNGIDDNCDGLVDEGVLLIFYADTDQDGYGDANSTVEDCTEPSGYVSNADDCNDNDAGINPGATEIADNGIDEDCDGEDLMTGTDELVELSIRIYPNPVSDILWLENVPPTGYTISMFNVFGQDVTHRLNDYQLDCRSLPSGTYMLVVTEEVTLRRKVSLVVKN